MIGEKHTVIIEESREGGMKCRIGKRTAFPDRKQQRLSQTPQVGDEWEVEIVGTNPRETVLFFRFIAIIETKEERTERERSEYKEREREYKRQQRVRLGEVKSHFLAEYKNGEEMIGVVFYLNSFWVFPVINGERDEYGDPILIDVKTHFCWNNDPSRTAFFLKPKAKKGDVFICRFSTDKSNVILVRKVDDLPYQSLVEEAKGTSETRREKALRDARKKKAEAEAEALRLRIQDWERTKSRLFEFLVPFEEFDGIFMKVGTDTRYPNHFDRSRWASWWEDARREIEEIVTPMGGVVEGEGYKVMVTFPNDFTEPELSAFITDARVDGGDDEWGFYGYRFFSMWWRPTYLQVGLPDKETEEGRREIMERVRQSIWWREVWVQKRFNQYGIKNRYEIERDD